MEEPRSRRERPAKEALTRRGIVASAVDVMRAEGLDRVTMRRLAKELDTGPASLYVYFRNTAQLHAAVLDELLGAVDLAPVDAGGDWRERLEAVLASYTLVLFEYPSLARSAVTARPTGPNYLRLVESILALLDEGGVPPGQASWGIDLLLQLATSTAAEHAGGDDPEAWDALAAVLRAVKPETYPRIAALGEDLLSGAGPDRSSWGIRALINGVLATPRPEGETA
ncbi:TetR/AcrR family transcriptional regulator [Kribbella sp. NPDC049584]|uniref:TetR/AcrR family transcriptional regulator n=1 Tax=Kribbella sp. NPDC049584 TaxID=3154833 RepID=UPI00341D50E9